MAGLGGLHRAVSHLSRHLARLRVLQASTHNLGCPALLHTSPALDAEGIPIKMPSLSPTMLEGTLVQWMKQEGDAIQPGDVLCDIQTDKAVVAMDIEEEGTLAKILMQQLKGGTTGIFDKDGDDDESGSYIEDLLEALTDISVHYNPEIKESTQYSPQSTSPHHRKTCLGSHEEAKQGKHNTDLPDIKPPPAMKIPIVHSATFDNGSGDIKKEDSRTICTHTNIHEQMNDEHARVKLSITHEEEMESIDVELPSVENLPTHSEALNTIHENHNTGATTRILTIDTAPHADPHPIDLNSDLTQIQKENLENFTASITENTINSSFDVTEDCYEPPGVDVANQESGKEYEGDLDQGIHESSVTGGVCVEWQEGGAESLAANGSSSVPQIPSDTKDVKVGTVIALMVAEGEDWKDVEMPSIEGEAPSPAATETPRKAAEGNTDHGNYGPSVRLLLEQYGLREDDVPHGGPHGILVKGDVLRLIKERNLKAKTPESVAPPEAPKSAAAPPSSSQPPPAPSTIAGDGYKDVEVTSMRRTIAKRLTQSKSGIAHSYATMECRMDTLLELRKQYKAEGVNVSVNDLIIKAVAVALSRCPEMNCVWQGEELKTGGQVDISVAVATPSGLITPIVRGADTRGLEDIAATVRDLATRAKDNKLKLDEFQGGTFTISNLGMFGIREFSAIINPPQCGILAVGGSRLVPDESGVPVTLMASQLSYDRGAVDDMVAAEFLSSLKSILENPKTILLGSYASQPHPLAALL